jgi:hypothetical protein
MKKITGEKAKHHYQTIDNQTGEIIVKTPEFNRMSRRPGIASRWLEKYTADVYPNGEMIINGKKYNSTRYYDQKFKKQDQLSYEEMQYQKNIRAKANAQDNSPERLKAKEQVAIARARYLKRNKT